MSNSITDDIHTIDVALGERSYPVHVGSGLIGRAAALLGDAMPMRRAIVVTNPLVAAHFLAALRANLDAARIDNDAVVIADGEQHKTLATVEGVLTRLLEARAERGTTLIALGGGVVGDVTGFAAAIYQRGMPFVQIPTTLLAQVDSSVGGKTGVNHPLGKNMIGAFYQPRAVIADTDCLRTLTERDFAAGLAEVIKYGAISDAQFFSWLEANVERLRARDAAALTEAIAQSCRIKARIVAADERESGERALLNFGHTFGHAIEAALGYGEWLHGEAVAAGMVMAAMLSHRLGMIDEAAVSRLTRLIDRAGLPIAAPKLGKERWLDLMRGDKKVRAGGMRFILLERIGAARLLSDVPAAPLESVLA